MSEYRVHVQFWAKLTFENKKLEQYISDQADLSKALWRPNFVYDLNSKEGYKIWPIARNGDEFGFFALNPEIWMNVHQMKIQPGVEFFLSPSSKGVAAKGVVTHLEESPTSRS